MSPTLEVEGLKANSDLEHNRTRQSEGGRWENRVLAQTRMGTASKKQVVLTAEMDTAVQIRLRDLNRGLEAPSLVSPGLGLFGLIRIGLDADTDTVPAPVGLMERKPSDQSARLKALLLEVDAVADPWPDEGFPHLPLKNVRKVRVHLNRVGPLPPRIAYDPDRE